MAVHASQIFGTQDFFEDFRKDKGRPPVTNYSENPDPQTQPSALPPSPPSPTSAVASAPTLIHYAAVPTPSQPIASSVYTAGGGRINREIQPEDMVIVKINSEAEDGEVTMLKQVSLEEQENDLESYIDDVFQERLDTQASEKVNTVAQFGQEWDVMEDYIDLNVAPTSVHVVDTNMMVTNHLPSEDIIYQENEFVSSDDDGYGQQWDIMEEYIDVPEDKINADPASEYDETQVSDENFQVYSQDDFSRVDENQILPLNAEISSQEENLYYNHHNPVVHEHLIQDYDYSGYIPAINVEYVDYGSGPENSLGYEPSILPSVPEHVDSNHLDLNYIQHRDMQSRNQLSEILSEEMVEETTTQAITLESDSTEAVTVATSVPTTAEEKETNDYVQETTTFINTTTLSSTTSTTTEKPTILKQDLAPEGVLISEDLTLPPALEALNLVTEKIESPSEKALTLPEAEPLVSRKSEDMFVLPAGHGLRFKFKIRDLDFYNPDFGFQSK